MDLIERYISYISLQKRYSERTAAIYNDALRSFEDFCEGDALEEMLTHNIIRSYQIHLLDGKHMSPRTVNLHLSVLSGFCRYLVRQGVLKSNPVQLVTRPKTSKRLPQFFRESSMEKYLSMDNALRRRDFELDLSTPEERRDTYWLCLRRAIVCLLYSTGMRRAELIGLRLSDLDVQRASLRVVGKGDKMREIPLVASCIQEILLYLQSVEKLVGGVRTADSPLLVTYSGAGLYPVIVDRAVKAELGEAGQDFAGKKSPHMLRHSLATGLLEEGADLNSIKEVLGHANLAATQVYTHSSPSQLQKIYNAAHPRAGKKK